MALNAARKLPSFVLAAAVLAVSGCASNDDSEAGSEPPAMEVAPDPVLTATVRLPRGSGQGISAMAAGEGAVWTARAGCVGSVSRIDPDSNEVVATIPVGFLVDVAVGEGAVWALGSICGEGDRGTKGGAVFRIDPNNNGLVETIPLELQGGKRTHITEHMAAGEGGVWVSVESSGAGADSILRIDPRTNEITARIPARGTPPAKGAPFNIAAQAGAVWALVEGKPRREGASLLRIDPETNEVTATLAPGQLEGGGGSLGQPRMAIGEDEIWLRHYRGPTRVSRAAVHVDLETNEVSQEGLDTGGFYPFAVVGNGVWFLDGRTVDRLNVDTLERDAAVKAGTGLDAVFEPESRSIWVADHNFSGDIESQSVVRVDLR